MGLYKPDPELIAIFVKLGMQDHDKANREDVPFILEIATRFENTKQKKLRESKNVR